MGRNSLVLLLISLTVPCWSELFVTHGSRLRLSANYNHIRNATAGGVVLGHLKFHFDGHQQPTGKLLRISTGGESFDCGIGNGSVQSKNSVGGKSSERRILFQISEGRLIRDCDDQSGFMEAPLRSHNDTLVLELEFFPDAKNLSGCVKLEILNEEVNCSGPHQLHNIDPEIDLEPLNIRCQSGCESPFQDEKKGVGHSTTTKPLMTTTVTERPHVGVLLPLRAESLAHCNGHSSTGELPICDDNADQIPCGADEVCLRLRNSQVVGDFWCAKWQNDTSADSRNFSCDWFSSLNASIFAASLVGEALIHRSVVFRKIHRDPPNLLAVATPTIPPPPIFVTSPHLSVEKRVDSGNGTLHKKPQIFSSGNANPNDTATPLISSETSGNGTPPTVATTAGIGVIVSSPTETVPTETTTVATTSGSSTSPTTTETTSAATTVASTVPVTSPSTSTAVGTTAAVATGGSSPNVGAIVGGIFGALLGIGLIVGGYFLFRYIRRSRKLKGKYNPAKEEMTAGGTNPLPMVAVGKEERLI